MYLYRYRLYVYILHLSWQKILNTEEWHLNYSFSSIKKIRATISEGTDLCINSHVIPY